MRKRLLTEFMMQAPIQPATNYWRAVEIEEVIRYGMPEGRGLDIGCGDGHLMSIILGHTGPRDLLGLDIDPEETALAAKHKIYRQVVTGSASRLPFTTSSLDFVFSNSVLEHIDQIDAVLVEVARVLRRGGRFLFTVPGADFHRCLKGPLFGDREKYLRDTDARCAHLRYWDSAQWGEHLEAAGFKPIHQHSYLTRAQVQRWESIARKTSGILYRVSGRKRQPIKIQRMMKLRTPKVRFPRLLAKLCAGVMDIGARVPDHLHGCLLVDASRAE